MADFVFEEAMKRLEQIVQQLEKGDVVLVPTRDESKNREVIRKAAVAHENHKIDPAQHPYTIKKIIGVIKRHAETALTSTPEEK